jgi:hypothetical protein
MYFDNAVSAVETNNEKIAGKIFKVINLEKCACMRQ